MPCERSESCPIGQVGWGSADEVVIDGNRYRYRCQNLDLPLERRGTAVLLEYIGSINA